MKLNEIMVKRMVWNDALESFAVARDKMWEEVDELVSTELCDDLSARLGVGYRNAHRMTSRGVLKSDLWAQ